MKKYIFLILFLFTIFIFFAGAEEAKACTTSSDCQNGGSCTVGGCNLDGTVCWDSFCSGGYTGPPGYTCYRCGLGGFCSSYTSTSGCGPDDCSSCSGGGGGRDSCTVEYSLNPSPPENVNTNVGVTFPTLSTPNNRCVALLQDDVLQGCMADSGAPNGFRCSVYSGSTGATHTLQLKYGQSSYYPGLDCGTAIDCNSTTYDVTAPPPANSSSCGPVTAPDTITINEPFSATVKMNNTGSATWTSGGNYHLGSNNPHDNLNWGVKRVDTGSVAPGTTATFNVNATATIQATAPSVPGTWDFSWQMVQDGIGWFGPSCGKLINVVNPPPPAAVCGRVTNKATGVGVANVQVNLLKGGLLTATRTTDSSGSYSYPTGTIGTGDLYDLYVVNTSVPVGTTIKAAPPAGISLGANNPIGWTWRTTTAGRDTKTSDSQFNFQKLGTNDCATSGTGRSPDQYNNACRCNFNLTFPPTPTLTPTITTTPTITPAPTCNAVNLKNATGNYGLISSVVPTANRINWAYSDIIAGTASACTVTITGCGASTGARGCYVTPDAGTSHYRARVDFTPTTGACNITFVLHPPVSGGDTCSGTSAPVCSPINGVCSAWGGWSCSGGNRVRSRTYTAPTCGGSDVACFPLTDTLSCADTNSCTTDSCSAGTCIHTNNPVNGAWSAWGACSGTCGTEYQLRVCNNPLAACGGLGCLKSDGVSRTTISDPTETRVCPGLPACADWLETRGGDVHSNLP